QACSLLSSLDEPGRRRGVQRSMTGQRAPGRQVFRSAGVARREAQHLAALHRLEPESELEDEVAAAEVAGVPLGVEARRGRGAAPALARRRGAVAFAPEEAGGSRAAHRALELVRSTPSGAPAFAMVDVLADLPHERAGVAVEPAREAGEAERRAFESEH